MGIIFIALCFLDSEQRSWGRAGRWGGAPGCAPPAADSARAWCWPPGPSSARHRGSDHFATSDTCGGHKAGPAVLSPHRPFPWACPCQFLRTSQTCPLLSESGPPSPVALLSPRCPAGAISPHWGASPALAQPRPRRWSPPASRVPAQPQLLTHRLTGLPVVPRPHVPAPCSLGTRSLRGWSTVSDLVLCFAEDYAVLLWNVP